MNSKTKLIITVKEARKLLGKEHAEMSDDQIEELIILLSDIAEASIKQSIERIKNGDKP